MLQTGRRFEIEEIVKMVRLNLYNQDLFCGAQAILWELEDLGVKPLPSVRTINRILSRNELTHRRTGKYEPKGTPYPKLPALLPNQTHQMDMVGPCYLTGPLRFYGLNVIDAATARCGLHSSQSKAGQDVVDGVWSIWSRLGIPDNLQIDNALSFFGSPKYPRATSQFIRLCLRNGVEPWFIPMSEPWRNGIIEQFNDHYQQKFLGKVFMTTADELRMGTLAFEQRHNSKYRYSKLGGLSLPSDHAVANNALAIRIIFPLIRMMPVFFQQAGFTSSAGQTQKRCGIYRKVPHLLILASLPDPNEFQSACETGLHLELWANGSSASLFCKLP